MLLDNGASVEAVNHEGLNVLMQLAACPSPVQMAQFLLEHGACLEAKSSGERLETPFPYYFPIGNATALEYARAALWEIEHEEEG